MRSRANDDEIPADVRAARVAAAIGEPARARMLFALMDGRARTSIELAAIADVGAPTASAHLQRLFGEALVAVRASGRHKYYALASDDVGRILESLNVFAAATATYVPTAPPALRYARTCYDHLAGTIAVAFFDRAMSSGWIAQRDDDDVVISDDGRAAFGSIGVDIDAAAARKRRFAYACLDWSERRFHLAGSLGAALLAHMVRERWVAREEETRLVRLTTRGRQTLLRFGVRVDAPASTSV